GWLRAARAQKALGWTARMGLDGSRHVMVIMDSPGFVASGTAHHPLGRVPAMPLVFAVQADGSLRSTARLPEGRWQLRIAIHRDGRVMRLAETMP
ncbi:FixH family protein, partial [Sandarakinorhabdus sp.]|uniref:FixH family protein n=1 Tax=Sandarakinorhabdus sp. TaxID=1916663 RepID=UPI00286EAE55